MPRGGKRPGAGAPRDNLNALKHGRRSRQLRQLFTAATRSRARKVLSKVLDAALLTTAGLVRKRRTASPPPPDETAHQTGDDE